MFPRRGAIALVTKAIALVLLFNFKTPDALPSGDSLALTTGTTTTPRGTPGATAPPRSTATP